MRAVVGGAIGTFAVGGVAWDYGQYALGLEQMGFEVYYLEDTSMYAYDPTVNEYIADCTYGAAFIERFFSATSPTLGTRWHLRGPDDREYGMDGTEFAAIVRDADLFLNVSGITLLREEYVGRGTTVFVDTDPGWNHFVTLTHEWQSGRPPGVLGF